MSNSAHRTLGEVAQRWSCSKMHVSRIVAAGRLQGIDIGIGKTRRLIFSIEEIERYERDRSTSAKTK